MRIRENVSLLPYNTFGMNVKADYLAEYATPDELKEILSGEVVRQTKCLVLGQGSNMLFLSDYKGVVIHSCYRMVNVVDEDEQAVYVEVGSGMLWDDFVSICVDNGWYGAENLSLIPGQVGSAAVQNIGAYGVEAKDVIHKVHALDIVTGADRLFTNAECHYGYRDSLFKNAAKGKYVISSVVFRLKKHPVYSLNYKHLEEAVRQQGELSLANVRKTIVEMRNSVMPDLHQRGNAGSFFKNPIVARPHFEALLAAYPAMPHYYVSESEEKLSAAWLIEQCGWKGRQVGAAGVHDKHSLILINLGGATGSDIYRLAVMIQQSVRESFGVELYPEVDYVD